MYEGNYTPVEHGSDEAESVFSDGGWGGQGKKLPKSPALVLKNTTLVPLTEEKGRSYMKKRP